MTRKKINDKEKKDKSKTMENINKKKSTYKICRILTVIIVAAISIISFKIYKNFISIPDLPELDIDEWWGTNVTRDNQDVSLRPFRVVFTDSMQERLTKRFLMNRQRSYPKSLEGAASNYGISSEAIELISDHWHFKYNFKEREKFLNKFDHFKTNIQGLDIHFVHVKPKADEDVQVLPILLLHGWPGSIREFYELIPLLTTKSDYGFVFEVIAPSLPGFAYSQAASKPGLGPAKIAIIMRNLMHRLGFKQFFIQGGDFGHAIGSHIVTIFPEDVLGFHSNYLGDFSRIGTLTWILGGLWPSLVVDEGMQERLYPLKDKVQFLMEETGYMHLQGTKPDTIGIALSDSPLGLAAYILDKFIVFTDPSNRNLTDGGLKHYDLDGLLDNVMLYWTTGSITSSMRLYKEKFLNLELENLLYSIPTPVPTWGLQARHEVFFQPEWMIRRKFTNLLGTTQLKDGGHFIAFEKPSIVADDMFKAVKRFREFGKMSEL